MAINGISGRPGSGKSYEAVIRQIMPALQSGRKVVTNIPLNVEWFCTYVGEHCRDLIIQIDGGFHNYGGKRYFSDAEHFLRYQDWRNEKNQGVLFVVDECHLPMPRSSAADGVSTQRELKEYLSMHRHYGHDVILLSQNFRKVDRDIVDMIQTCYFTTKLSFLGKDDEYVCKVADGVSRNIVTTHRREYDKKYFGAYQSHTKSEGSVQEAESVDIPKWYHHWYNIGAIAMGFLFVFFLYTGLNSDKPQPESDPVQNIHFEKQQISSPPIATTAQAPQPQKPADKPQPEPEPEPDLKHPYQGVNMHIVGNYSDFNRGRLQKIIWISISRNGQVLTEITHADLALAGYEYTVLNDCLIDLKHGKFQQYVFCDSPTQSVSAPVLASAVSTDVSG
jgi:zona occludens toxin